MNKKIKLVLTGAGTLYPLHVGGILCLAEAGFEFSEVCGSSGGAIVAAALGTGYVPNNELTKFIKKTLPSKGKFMKKSAWSLFFKWGLIKTKKLRKFFDNFFVSSLGDTRIPVSIIATDVNKSAVKVFSSATDSELPLSAAVVASMSLPILFEPTELNKILYSDAAFAPALPFDIFGTGDDVIILRIGSKGSKPLGGKGIKGYISSSISSFISSNDNSHLPQAVWDRTIHILSDAPNFNLNTTDADVDSMILEGYQAVKIWLER